MDISNISFHCINEASDNEADAELNADYYRCTVQVNEFCTFAKFLNAEVFEVSEVY